MTPKQRREVELSQTKEALNALLVLEEMSIEQRADLDGLTVKAVQLERELRASILADGIVLETRNDEPDREMRERLELRESAKLTNYVLAAMRGQMPSGAEAELQSAAGVAGIPVELFDVRQRETRADATTSSPATNTGVHVDPVRPLIYARAVLPRLGVAMPRVPSGGYSTMTVTTGAVAGATAEGAARDSAALVLTPQGTTPHRVSARLTISVESVATVGVDNFESALRQNTMLAMSDRLDHLGLTGDNVAPNPQGLYPQLTDPTDPTDVVTWPLFVAAMASGIDGGPWSETLREVMLLVNPETMRLAESTFQVGTGEQATPGDISAAAYLRMNSAGFFSSRRMPATATTIAPCIIYRAGTMGMDGVDAMRTAVCPMWDEISIDDIYSDSASGLRHFTLHNMIGDVLIEQVAAYSRVDLKLA